MTSVHSNGATAHGISPDFPLTVEADELKFAITAAYGAAMGLTPRPSIKAGFETVSDAGGIRPGRATSMLTDHPLNHAGMAIVDAFPEASHGKCMALMNRTLFILPALLADARCAPFQRKDDKGVLIADILVRAVASTPIRVGREVPLDTIFERIEELTAEDAA